MNERQRAIWGVLARYEQHPVSPSGGFVRFPPEYTVASPAAALAEEIDAALPEAPPSEPPRCWWCRLWGRR